MSSSSSSSVPTVGALTELLLTCSFSAAPSIVYDWIWLKLRSGQSRDQVIREVLALQQTLPAFFSKAIESGLAANHLPTAPVPSSGSLPAFQSGASSDKAQTAIQSARSNNYPHVKEVLYEYIANKERSLNSWIGTKSYSFRWQTICDKLTKIEQAYRLKDAHAILPVIRHIRIVTGYLPLTRLVSILSTPSTNPGQAEWILSNFIRKRSLVAGRHTTSDEVSSALFSVYESSEANEGIYEAFQNARLLAGLEEGSTRPGVREVVEARGLKDQGGLEELVWKCQDETERAVLLREGLREWVMLERDRRPGIWWGVGDNSGERAKVGAALDEYDRFLCMSKPVYAYLRPVFQLVREQSDLPTSLPPHSVIPVFDLHPSSTLNLVTSRTSTNSNAHAPPSPSEVDAAVNVVETPATLDDEPGAQIVYSQLVEATSSLQMEEVLVDFSQQEFEKVLLEGREWGRQDKERLGRLLDLIEAAMPNARMSESAFFSVRQSSLALDASSSNHAESSVSQVAASFANDLTFPSPSTESPSTPWPPISNPSISISPSTSRPLPSPPTASGSSTFTSTFSSGSSSSGRPPVSPKLLPPLPTALEQDPFADPPDPADSLNASPSFLSTLRLLRDGPVLSSSAVQDLMLDWVQEEQQEGLRINGMEVVDRIAWGLDAFEQELGDPKLGKIFLRIRTIATLNAPISNSNTNITAHSSSTNSSLSPSSPYFSPTSPASTQHHRTTSFPTATRPDPSSLGSATLPPRTTSSTLVPSSLSPGSQTLPTRSLSNSSASRPPAPVIGAGQVQRDPEASSGGDGNEPAPPPYSFA